MLFCYLSTRWQICRIFRGNCGSHLFKYPRQYWDSWDRIKQIVGRSSGTWNRKNVLGFAAGRELEGGKLDDNVKRLFSKTIKIGYRWIWTQVLRHILADEAHHRDVNHTYADLPAGSENPFIHQHRANFDAAVVRRTQKLMKTLQDEASIRKWRFTESWWGLESWVN